MQNPSGTKAFAPISLIFIVVSAILLFARNTLQQWKIDVNILIAGNIILFAATAVSFFIHFKAIRNKNTQAFLRALYGSMFARMMICLVAVLIYVGIVGSGVNKNAVFGFMILYFLYTFTEVPILMKLSKQNKHV
ncbi:MAG: hypothetical protein QM731_25665 [Chitinophagaceae bacterium]